VSVAAPSRDYVVRPLDPPVPSTLGLIEHRNKPGSAALDIVRRALIGIQAMADIDLPQEDAAPPLALG
jgi:hypothetical protein